MDLLFQTTGNGSSRLEKIDAKREIRWMGSIAVRSAPFIERLKNIMGAMAKGHAVKPSEMAFEFRETQSTYISISDTKKRNIDIMKRLPI